MNHPVHYTHEQWARWYERVKMHTRLAPSLTRDLRGTGAANGALVATAAASLAELDEDIVAGEFLAKIMQASASGVAVTAIVDEMSLIAQELLQAIVEAKARADVAGKNRGRSWEEY